MLIVEVTEVTSGTLGGPERVSPTSFSGHVAYRRRRYRATRRKRGDRIVHRMGESMSIAHTNYFPIPVRVGSTRRCMVTVAGAMTGRFASGVLMK